jgi:LmbE family N-acetylglucosaminyl deacetylase
MRRRVGASNQIGQSNALRTRRHYSQKPLDNMRFGRGKLLRPIIDLRVPNQGVKTRFDIKSLFIGKTVVLSPHCDDASLNYGGGIISFSKAGGDIHIINVSPGYKAPFPTIKGNQPHDIERKVDIRKKEGQREARILGARFHFLDLRRLYEEKRIAGEEAKRLYQLLDQINPKTLVIPGPFDTHPDHRNVRTMSLNWAAAKANSGTSIVIVEAPSMWGSIPETHLTHLLEMDKPTFGQRLRAQKAHVSQYTRTDFPSVSTHKARANAIVGGELVHGLVEKTPQLKPTEMYSQHVIMKQGNRLILTRTG